MRIDLAGWSSTGLRCPDVAVDLRNDAGALPKVALIQMPNGTGKTTTLQLLNATLSGSAEHWTAERIRSYRRKNDPAERGQFKTTLLVDGRPLTFELTLDYEAGRTTYKTTSPGSGGVVSSWNPPHQVRRFLTPEFLHLFIFDGELANRLLDSDRSEADRAVDALCQIYVLDQVAEFTRDFWERSTKQNTAKTSSGLNRWQEALTQLRQRDAQIKKAQNDAKARLKGLEAEEVDLNEKIQLHIGAVEAIREKFETAQLDFVAAQGEVKAGNAALMSAMRLPHALHPDLEARLFGLRDNLDRLKLPETTTAQFFEELVREKECICGRPMDQHSVQEIRDRAKHYLDTDEAGVINALKRNIEQFSSSADDEDAGYVRVTRLAKELSQAVRREKEAEGQVRAMKQQLIDGGDDQLAIWQANLDKCLEQVEAIRHLLADIEGPGDVEAPNDKLMSLSLIQKRIDEAKARIAEITETVRLKEQTDLIQKILDRSATLARKRIKEELLTECNTRLETILANDPLKIERIDRSIRLEDQDGASVGQTLSVGYTFLMSVLNRGSNDFPLIVDSPANPIDQGVRRKIGRLIPELCSQFVAFTINTERPGFVDTLETAAKDVTFLTLFRKTPGTVRLMKALPKGRYDETDTAVLVNDRDYFYAFDVRDEEDEENVQAAQ